MQRSEVIQGFYLIDLKGISLVLRLDWLASLGEVKADFDRLELTVKRGEQVLKITGDTALMKTELSFGAFMQVLKEGEGLMT